MKIRTILYSLLLVVFSVSASNAQVHLAMSPGIQTETTGDVQIYLSGDMINNGNFSGNGGAIILNGVLDQILFNSGGSLNHLECNKPFGSVVCTSDLLVDGNVDVLAGDVQLNGQIITMTSGFLSELPGQTVRGNSGFLYTSRNYGVVAGNTGFGLELTSAGDIGISEIYRGHNALTGNGNGSINRWYEIQSPATLASTTALVFHYDDSELAGQTELDLKLYKSLDGGITWLEIPGILDEAINTFTAMDVGDVGMLTLSALEMAVVDCPFDLNADLVVNTLDLLLLLASFGCDTGACPVDFTGDGNTNTSDLLMFLGNFGSYCTE